jgi:hypothetical protein
MSARKSGDLDTRQILAMAALPLRILPPALLEGNRLRPARMFDDFARDTGTCDKGGPQSRCAVARQHENMIERHGISGLASERHNGDRVSGGDAILLASGFDDCEQLASLEFQALRTPSATC